jgi:hypothetical protein
MIDVARWALITAAVLSPQMARAASAACPSADSLIARHIQARGGDAAMAAIHTLDMRGTMRPPGFSADLDYREVIARPGSVRIEVTLQGLTPIQAYDGEHGWQIQPFQGRKDPEALSSDDDKSLEEEADFEDALTTSKARGAVVANLGEVDVDGGPTYALRVDLKNGDQETYYLDPESYLTVRVLTRQLKRGAESLTQTDYGDYEKVDGVYFPFEVDSGPKGASDMQRITYRSIKANTPVDLAMFKEPRGPAGGVQQAVTPTQREDFPVAPTTTPPGAPPPNPSVVKPAGAPPQS